MRVLAQGLESQEARTRTRTRTRIAVALRLNAPPVIDVGAEVLSPMSCITRWASLTRIGTENALACAIIDGTVAVAYQAQDFE